MEAIFRAISHPQAFFGSARLVNTLCMGHKLYWNILEHAAQVPQVARLKKQELLDV